MNFNLSDKFEGKIALKTGVAAALSWTVGMGFSNLFNRPDGLVSGLWTVVTAVVVLQANLGGTYNAALQRFLGIVIGSILGAGFTSLMGADPLSLGVSIFFTVVFCALFGLKESIRIACLSVCVIMVLWGIRPEISPWTFGLFRFLDSCLGILIAVTVAHTLWPAKAVTIIQKDLAKTLTGLSKLYRMAASLNGSQEGHLTSSDLLMDELNELLRSSRDILEESKLEVLTRYSSLDDWKLLIGLQEELCDSVSTLRDIDKHNLAIIIDDALAENLAELTDLTDRMFQELAGLLEKGTARKGFSSELMQKSLEVMQSDLERFRSTKATRKFDLHDVESFFVFFYTIVAITKQLTKLEPVINKLVL